VYLHDMLHELVPGISRYVYLDADTVVQTSLWDLLAECKDPPCAVKVSAQGEFNTGVMVLDANCPLVHIPGDYENDTQWLNAMFKGNVSFVSNKWNVMGLGEFLNIPSHLLESAGILHWTGKYKPWKRNGYYKELFLPSQVKFVQF
jgi:lipopolysaccharide biosynthesis glycosyltransferase